MPPRLTLPARLTAAVGVALTAGCSGAVRATSTPTTPVAPSTSIVVAPTTGSAPPVTAFVPSAAQPSPDSAAGALVNYWSAGQRQAAAAVASPQAVATLFAQPYPSGFVQSRGCTDSSTDPGTCTYADRESSSLYEIGVTRIATGWYVSSVTVES